MTISTKSRFFVILVCFEAETCLTCLSEQITDVKEFSEVWPGSIRITEISLLIIMRLSQYIREAYGYTRRKGHPQIA